MKCFRPLVFALSFLLGAAEGKAGDVTAPSDPSILSATTLSSSRIGLAWSASFDNVEVTQYEIYRCPGTSCTPNRLVATTPAGYTDTDLAAGTTYSYRVRAVDEAGNRSGFTNIDTTTTDSSDGPIELPELPRSYVDTTFNLPTSGTTWTPTTSAAFGAALNDAQPGDVIVLDADTTYVGPFTLPEKGGSDWIYIVSSNLNELPEPGNRVSPDEASNMPTIIAAYGGSAIATNSRAHHYRLVGLEFQPQASAFIYELISIGQGEDDPSQLPHDITIDRCYIHGNPGEETRRGVSLDGIRVALVDSYISDIKESGSDSQAVWAYNTPGPLKIVNNHLEAAGENIMFGGAQSAAPNMLPSDIEIRGNHVFKPLSWIGEPWDVKNLIEFKVGVRILVEGNVFENNWADAQTGLSMLAGPRNENGTAPWSTTKDVTYRRNIFTNIEGGFNLGSDDDNFPATVGGRMLIEDNLIQLVSHGQGGDRRIYQLLGARDTTIRHNTSFVDGGHLGLSESNPPMDGLNFTYNITSLGTYGFGGTGTWDGNETLETYFINKKFEYNAIIGPDDSSNYPDNNYFPSDKGAVGFLDLSGGDYRLTSSSPYKDFGTEEIDLGADIDALAEATACAVSGQCAGNDPVAAYAFDEGTGTTLGDASARNNDGTINGATWTTGKYGGALLFDGSSDLVTIPDDSSLDLTTEMTIEAWVYPIDPINWQTIVLKETDSDAVYSLYASDDQNIPDAYFNFSNGAIRGGSQLPTNTWSYVAATFDRGVVKLYVNGSLVVETAGRPDTLSTSPGALRIGGNEVWGEYFEGRIDEVRIYDVALGQNAIQIDMNTPIGGGTAP